VHNPATLTVGLSATDPILQDIHIDPNDTADLDTELHELGHAWMYPHVTGEGCLTWTAVLSGSTHDAQESPCTAISEGFAEFFSNKLEQEMNTAGLLHSSEASNSTTPRNRAQLAQTFGLPDMWALEGSDSGWEQVFRVLTSSDIIRQLFGDAAGTPGFVSTYTGPLSCFMPIGQDDLADALQIIGDAQDQFDISNDPDPNSTLTVFDVLTRADERLSGFDLSDRLAYHSIIDPSSEQEPHERYRC
jgi:hypothetical protein